MFYARANAYEISVEQINVKLTLVIWFNTDKNLKQKKEWKKVNLEQSL